MLNFSVLSHEASYGDKGKTCSTHGTHAVDTVNL